MSWLLYAVAGGLGYFAFKNEIDAFISGGKSITLKPGTRYHMRGSVVPPFEPTQIPPPAMVQGTQGVATIVGYDSPGTWNALFQNDRTRTVFTKVPFTLVAGRKLIVESVTELP